MSKAKLIELIKMDRRDLMVKLNDMSRFGEDVADFQNILRQALKDQDRDTRQGCADDIVFIDSYNYDQSVMKDLAYNSCLNYKDKDLEGL